MDPAYRARVEAARPRFKATMKDLHNVDINEGPFGINSKPSLVGMKFALAHDLGEAYHDAVLEAYWERALDISQIAILRELAEGVGLDGAAFQAALTDPTFISLMEADVLFAYRNGIRAVPSLVFANKYLVSGAQPYDVLADVVRQVQAAESANGESPPAE